MEQTLTNTGQRYYIDFLLEVPSCAFHDMIIVEYHLLGYDAV
jgi:hypothetical protein